MKFQLLVLLIAAALSFDLYALEYRAYDFADLSKRLGYPSETYFGSMEGEIFDLETYTSKEDEFYKEINGYLRFHPAPYDWSGTTPEMARAIVANIDNIFARSPSVPQDLILFRGINLRHRKNKAFKIGEEFVEKGYVSTSTSFKVARYFAVEKDDQSKDSKKAVFVLYQNLPDQKGILIDQHEDEVILKHHQRLKVMARKTSASYETYLVQLCKTRCDLRMNKDITRFWKNYKRP